MSCGGPEARLPIRCRLRHGSTADGSSIIDSYIELGVVGDPNGVIGKNELGLCTPSIGVVEFSCSVTAENPGRAQSRVAWTTRLAASASLMAPRAAPSAASPTRKPSLARRTPRRRAAWRPRSGRWPRRTDDRPDSVPNAAPCAVIGPVVRHYEAWSEECRCRSEECGRGRKNAGLGWKNAGVGWKNAGLGRMDGLVSSPHSPRATLLGPPEVVRAPGGGPGSSRPA